MVFLWIAAYGLVYTLACSLPQTARPWGVPLAMIGYAAALIGWILRTGRAKEIWLCAVPGKTFWDFLLLPPLLMLPVCNLLMAKAFSPSLPTVLLMLSVCTVEEVFFRGFLLRRLMRFGTLAAILLSSGIFALFHLANLMGGSSFIDPWMQLACGFAVGICYGAVTIQLGSLVPCLLSHFLTNITAVPVSAEAVPWLWLCMAAYGCLDIFLCKRIVNRTA